MNYPQPTRRSKASAPSVKHPSAPTEPNHRNANTPGARTHGNQTTRGPELHRQLAPSLPPLSARRTRHGRGNLIGRSVAGRRACCPGLKKRQPESASSTNVAAPQRRNLITHRASADRRLADPLTTVRLCQGRRATGLEYGAGRPGAMCCPTRQSSSPPAGAAPVEGGGVATPDCFLVSPADAAPESGLYLVVVVLF